MRTTIDLPDDLFREAKARAALEGVPLRRVIEEALRTALAGQSARPKPKRVKFPLHRSRQPGTLGAAELRAIEEAAYMKEDAAHAGDL